MITKYLRELLKPIINDCMYENEGSISNRYIADMNRIHKDLFDIRMELIQMQVNASFYTIHTKIDKIEALLSEKDLTGTDAFGLAIKNS